VTPSEKAKAYRAKNPGKAAADAKAWREKNPTKASEDSARYYAANRETEKQRTAAYRRANPERYRQLDRARNKDKVAKNALRRARKLQATPPWLTEEQLEQMRKIYRTCPPGHHVDHIYPLNHPLCCGLHVPWNLQHLSVEENLAKGNKLPGEF
jgi:5-methylcytosine-specific restriction endonuclease McrA